VLALGTYFARWEILNQRSYARGSEIEASLPRTVAFVYALSRSGMAFPSVMRTLAANERVYGEAARELSVAVRDMNTFGTDVITALRRTSERTPSENMEEFAENLASVLGSGRSIPEFLHDQYQRYQEEAEAQQEQYLELLSTFAEAYVTVLVAGPLFFITILVVIGLVLEDTLPILRIVVYVALPLASGAFIAYIDSVTGSFHGSGESATENDRIDGTEFTYRTAGSRRDAPAATFAARATSGS
jgi:flagellar protein FlaJ